MRWCTDHPAEVERMGTAMRGKALVKYRWDTIIDLYVEIYEQLIAGQ